MASRSAIDMTEAPAIGASVAETTWESTRCRCCMRLLCKNTRNALRPECVIEIKCGDCKTMNYLMGRPDDPPSRGKVE
jgi:phage FluMu protein Com